MYARVLFTLVCLNAIWESDAAGQFRVATSYGDHMVLQKAPQKANIWGFASKLSETVTVAIVGKGSVSTKTRHGEQPETIVWSAVLPAVKAGGPYVITVTSSEGKITLSDVMFGDVWVCSGQSNMQFTMNMAFNATEEIADADNYPNIRVISSVQKAMATPQMELPGLDQTWARASSKTIGGQTWKKFSALCFMYGKRLYNTLKYPIGLVASSFGGTPDEAWSSADALKKCYKPQELRTLKYDAKGNVNQFTPSVLWNGQMKPLLNMTIYGVVWYQGESNSHVHSHELEYYSCSFPAMIDDWRAKWSEGSSGQTSNMFPFGFVQIAAFRTLSNVDSVWPQMRWHQTGDYGYVPNKRLVNVFMAVAMDLPDFKSPWGSIHPRDKQDIAERLSTEAMIVAYNRTGLVSQRGPYPTDYTEVVGGKDEIIITYDSKMSTIEKRSNDGFEICCVARDDIPNPSSKCSLLSPATEWTPVPIASSDAHSVTLDYGSICHGHTSYIGGVRYAWRESPCDVKQCAIYNHHSGFPAAPFIHFITV